MMFSTKVVTKSRRNRSGRISTSRDVVGWVRLGEKVKTTSRTIRGRGIAKALREVRAWLRQAIEEGAASEAASRAASRKRNAQRGRSPSGVARSGRAKPQRAGRKRGS